MPTQSGFKALILSKGYSLAAFARVMNIAPQALNNWIARGIPGARVFDAADALEVGVEDLRPFTSEGRKPLTADEAEIRRFQMMFRTMPEAEKRRVLAKLKTYLRPD